MTLLGSASIAGVTRMEIDGKTFSKGLDKIRQFVADIFSRKADLSWTFPSSNYSQFFSSIGGAISSAAQEVWSFIQTDIVPSITSLNAKHLDPLISVQNFFKSLLEPEIFNRIFENLHVKIANVFSFAVNGQSKGSFLDLFSSKNRKSSLKAAKFLLGLPIDGNHNLRAKHNVFNYLLLKWMDDPDRVTEKFKRLSDTINNWTSRFSGSGSGSGGGASSDNVYELDIKTVEEYLNVQEGWSETLYKTIWGAEIWSKITTGFDLTLGGKSWLV